MMKIYLAGKIDGDDNFYEKFINHEKMLIEQLGDIEVINPVRIECYDWDYKQRIMKDIEEISNCDAICLISDYKDSRGSLAELYFAAAIKLDIYYFLPNGKVTKL